MQSVRAGARWWSRSGKRSRLGRPGMIMAPAALALLVAGCQAAPGGSGQAVNQQITVASVPGFANAPLQVAVRDGLFARYHVDVNVQTYPTLQRAYAALGSGQAEVISGDYAGLLYAQSHPPGARLRLIADGYDATPGLMEVLTLPGSPITNPQQLEGSGVPTALPSSCCGLVTGEPGSVSTSIRPGVASYPSAISRSRAPDGCDCAYSSPA